MSVFSWRARRMCGPVLLAEINPKLFSVRLETCMRRSAAIYENGNYARAMFMRNTNNYKNNRVRIRPAAHEFLPKTQRGADEAKPFLQPEKNTHPAHNTHFRPHPV